MLFQAVSRVVATDDISYQSSMSIGTPPQKGYDQLTADRGGWMGAHTMKRSPQ